MEAKDVRALRTAIERRTFEPAYYISGDDEYRKDALVRSLVDALVDAPMRDFNLDVFRGADVEPDRVESLLNTPPMMADRRAVVIRDSGSLKKDARATIERYLKRPSPDAVLVLVALAGTKEEKGFAAANAVLVAPLDGPSMPTWLVDHARSVHGAALEETAAAHLLEAVGLDTAQLVGEVDKLVSYAQGRAITVRDVDDVVGRREGEDSSSLLDLVAARNVPAALALTGPVLSQPKVTAVSLIMALTVQTLAMRWGRAARDRGMPAHQLEREYFTLLKETGAFPMRPWGEAVKCWSKHLGKWPARDLEQAMRALQRADHAAKDSRVSSDEQLLSTLICAMCVPETHALA
jgi:DNA polymerase-3 subunit delta